MISKKTEYGLKALLYLARHYNRGPVLIANLAHEEQIPKKFLEAILLLLKNNGILHSKKGKGGGYYLTRAPRDVTLAEAIRIMEGPMVPVPCLGGGGTYRFIECSNEGTCGIRLLMEEVEAAVATILERTTLEDVLFEVDKAEAQKQGVLNYCI